MHANKFIRKILTLGNLLPRSFSQGFYSLPQQFSIVQQMYCESKHKKNLKHNIECMKRKKKNIKCGIMLVRENSMCNEG